MAGATELYHERALATKVAFVRLVLTLVGFAILFLDPGKGFDRPYTLVAAGLFLLYALIALGAVRYEAVRLEYYLLVSPIFDVIMATYLVIMTGGYNSPFTLWFVFAIVGTGFGRYRSLPIFIAMLSMAALVAIAQMPQKEPLDADVYYARAIYLFGVASVIAFLGSYLANLSRTLAKVGEASTTLTQASSETDALRAFLWQTSELVGATHARVEIKDGPSYEEGQIDPEGRTQSRTFPIVSGGSPIGEITLSRPAAFSEQDEAVARMMCERAGAVLQRFRMETELMRAAANQERSRIADELHDTYLQTLAALDMRAEAAKQIGGDTNPELVKELSELKRIARQAADEAREVLKDATPVLEDGRGRLERVLRERWRGQAEIHIPNELRLSDGHWRALEMLLREGLNNAAKHGRATAVVFRITRLGDRIIARLEDNGKGPGEVIALGYGLQRLRTVLTQQGGMLTLENAPTRGAALIAEIWASDRQR